MTIKQLYPTQRPALDLNFAQQKRLDSRVTFTRGSTATYVGSDGLIKTAAGGEARFDHDPVTGESLGLLVEESKTNLITYSEEFDNAFWNKPAGGSVTANTDTAPDGTLTADTYSTSGNQIQTNFIPVTASTNYTGSIYIKKTVGRTYTVGVVLNYDGGTPYGILLNTNDGTTVAANYTLPTRVSVQNSGQYWRFSLTANSGSSVYVRLLVYPNLNSNAAVSAGSQVLWGAQVEAGSFPTSYIPTSGSTVARAADVANLTNSSIYDTDSFTILNEPFGSAAGGSTLSLVGAGETPIKRTAVYSQDLTQTQINASVGKTDEFWRWRILGDSFGLPQFFTDGQVTVDWGDGTVETLTTSDHTFTDGGGYHEIGFRLDSGTYFRPRINNNASHDTKVVAVGPAPESMKLNGYGAFFGCSALEAFDATVDATGGTDFYEAWRDCSSLTSFPLIDTSSGTNFRYAWQSCSSLTSFPLIDTSSGDSFYRAWYNNSSLTSFPLLDTSSGTNFQEAWLGCSGLTSFPAIDTSSGTNFGHTWRNCSSLTSFPLIDTSGGTSFTYAWYNCTSLTSFPAIDTSSGTDFYRTWYNNNSLTSFPLIDTSSGTNFYETWRNCSNLTSFPLIDTSSGTSFTFAWDNCNSLTSFPLINTSSVTDFSYTWRSCSSLTSFPLIDTSSGTSFLYTWYGCSSLTSFPLLDTSSGTSFGYTWRNCSSLTSFPLLDTSSGTIFDEAWQNCNSLTSFPLLDTSSGTSFTYTWSGCNSLTSFPAIDMSSGTNFFRAWYFCSSLTTFPANFFDSWTGTPANNCFFGTWDGCSSLTATSVENILNSIDTSGQSAPGSGVDITIDYNAGSGTPSIATAVTNLKSRGWTITLNGVAQ
jgi:hypothetical protein